MTRPLVVLITGCSSGFGLLTAARLASHGHRVHATMRDLKKRERLEIETALRNGEKNLFLHRMDVTDPVSIKQCLAEVMAQDGVIDVLVNNAGFGIGGFFEDLSDNDWREQFDTNFFGVLNVTRETLLVMRPRRQGRIINISSMAAFSGTPSFSAYVASKWAVEGFSECLHMELKPFNIDVALIEPGSYRTKIFTDNARYANDFNKTGSPYYALSQRLKDLVEKYVRKTLRDPEEVAITIEKVATCAKPRFRNIIGFQGKLRAWIVRHIPFELYSCMIRMFFFGQEKKHA